MRTLNEKRQYAGWWNMKNRCYNPNNIKYKNYGGRGIKVCDRWLGKDGYKNFKTDMGERPEGKTLDRIDVNGNYEPGNCRWATKKEQNSNKRLTILVKANGITKSLSAWSEELNIPYNKLYGRYIWGKSGEEIISDTEHLGIVYINYRGDKWVLNDLCKLAKGINHSTVRSRIMEGGWDIEKALTTPPRKLNGISKVCTSCKIEKELTEYSKKSGMCKKCKVQYGLKYRYKNKINSQ